MSNDLDNAIRILKTNSPGPFMVLLKHVEELEKTADVTLVSSISSKIMRQNQGKTQILRELLGTLRG